MNSLENANSRGHYFVPKREQEPVQFLEGVGAAGDWGNHSPMRVEMVEGGDS